MNASYLFAHSITNSSLSVLVKCSFILSPWDTVCLLSVVLFAVPFLAFSSFSSHLQTDRHAAHFLL